MRDFLRRHSANRVTRLHYRLSETAGRLEGRLPKREAKVLREQLAALERLERETRLLGLARGAALLLLYVSVASAILGEVFLIGAAIRTLAVVSGMAGSALLALAVAFCQRLIGIKVSEAHVAADYIVALDVKRAPRS